MICVLKSMCFPLQSRKSGQLYNAEVCGEVCSLILAFFRVQCLGKHRATARTLEPHECLDAVPFLISYSNTICQAVAKSILRLGETTFLLLVGTPVPIWQNSNQHGTGTKQWEGKPWNLALHCTIFKQFGTSNLPLQSGRWPQPCRNFLAICYGCTSISSRLPLCSSRELPLLLWQWRCPFLCPKCWRRLSWWMLFNSDLLIKVTSALTWSEAVVDSLKHLTVVKSLTW